jgi:hypothetical protein
LRTWHIGFHSGLPAGLDILDFEVTAISNDSDPLNAGEPPRRNPLPSGFRMARLINVTNDDQGQCVA